ncbi:MAG: hypothetical protein OHK0040_04400 [bacterium]
MASFSFKIKGGERHLNKIDWGEDALPTSAKSCHHGGEVSSPQKGIIKATYDNDYIYFEVSWDDKTKDNRTSRWKKGIFEANKDDGISIIFSKNPSFNCTETCHMSDWKVEEGKFYSDYRMYNDKDRNELILLRAEKTKGKPIMAIMQKDGKKTVTGEDIFIINSKNGFGKPSSFQLYQFLGNKDDVPYFPEKDEVFIINEKNQFLEGDLSFGFNHWKAVIKVPLSSFGLKNIKKGDKIYFAVAVFDGTQINHSISDTFTAIFE